MSLALLVLVAGAGWMLVLYMMRARSLASLQLQFVAGVSHDIRTPLTVIRGAAHNLLTGVVTEERERENYLRQIVRNADHLTHMVEQLLSYSATVRNPAKPPVSAVSLADALNAAVDLASDEIEAAGATLDIDIPAALPLVKGNAQALRQAFQNLIGNAAKHGGAGVISITASHEEPSRIRVRVADAGPGIAPQDLPHIFDPFYRGSAAHHNGSRGAGLGLSLVRERVEACGGKVSVEPAAEGAAFVVELQIAKETA